ncbi:MAG: hypothetical protein AVDCRST_MAG27-3666, partial [uncultured Craurococcus sp.]
GSPRPPAVARIAARPRAGPAATALDPRTLAAGDAGGADRHPVPDGRGPAPAGPARALRFEPRRCLRLCLQPDAGAGRGADAGFLWRHRRAGSRRRAGPGGGDAGPAAGAGRQDGLGLLHRAEARAGGMGREPGALCLLPGGDPRLAGELRPRPAGGGQGNAGSHSTSL